MDPITITFPGFKRLLGYQSIEDAPSSSSSIIVFPFDSLDKKFDRKGYSSDMIQGKANRDDIDQILTLLELIFPRIPTAFGLLTSWALRFLLPLILMLFLDQGRAFRDSYFIWTLLWIYWIIGIVYLLHDRDKRKRQAKTEIETVLKMVQPAYLRRGLRWRVPEKLGGWIELVKEYDGNEQLNVLIVKPDECEEKAERDSQYIPLQDIKE